MSTSPASSTEQQDSNLQAGATESPKKLPRGVVLGKDGKPCRSCTSVASWMAMAKQKTAEDGSSPATTASSATISAPTTGQVSECPPDVEVLGRSTWTLLHTMAASYPARAERSLQIKTSSFLSLFSEVYPCWVCAEDFSSWIKTPGNEPQVGGRDEFGLWMCRAHNAVNVKLGKKEFDCSGWEGRWRTGVGKGAGENCN